MERTRAPHGAPLVGRVCKRRRDRGAGRRRTLGASRSGRPALADAAYLGALEEAVETPPRQLGLGFDVWTSERLSAHVARTTGVRIAPGWLRVLLGEMRFACGRPKHTLSHLRDPEEVAACEVELVEAEKK